MNSAARSLCEYLCSRNNDIIGYWGIGFLCKATLSDKRRKISFKIRPGEIIRIYSYELSESKVITDKLVRHDLDSIEGRLSFFRDGRYPDGSQKFTCGISIAVTQSGRTGMYLCHVECWPHDWTKERRSARFAATQTPIIKKVVRAITGK